MYQAWNIEIISVLDEILVQLKNIESIGDEKENDINLKPKKV